MKSTLTCILLLCFISPARAELSRQPLSGEAYVLADLAYQAISQHNDAEAETLIVRARAIQPDSYQLAMLLLDTRIRRGSWEQARTLADELLAELPHDAQLLASSGFIAQFQKRYDAALEYFKAALKYPGLDGTQRLNIQQALDTLLPSAPVPAPKILTGDRYSLLSDAYRLQNEHKNEQALNAFQKAFALQAGTPEQYAAAAYAAKNAHQNELAAALFRQALDADKALPVAEQPFDVQQVFTYRREIQQLNRSWGATVALTYQRNALASTYQLNTLQGGAEVYWQPNDFAGNHDGRLFHVFAGAGETLYDAHGGQTGSRTAQGTLGVRYKPFGELGLMLVAQRIMPSSSITANDTFLHMGYFDAVGGELNVKESNWRNWQYFADAGYFINARRTYGLFEGNYGQAAHAGNSAERFIWTPHIVLAGEYDSAVAKPVAVSIGPGLKLQYWLREDTYNAPASRLEVNMQYRVELTRANRSQGLLMRAMYLY